MFNWYEIQVEQKIAQERYQPLLNGRSRPADKASGERGWNLQVAREWLGRRLVNWGCALQPHCQPVAE